LSPSSLPSVLTPKKRHSPRPGDIREDSVAPTPSNPANAAKPGGIAHEVGDLHRLLVETVQDYAIFALDPHGYILSWNAGAQRFKGYTAEEIIGQHFSIFYPRDLVAEGFPEFELRTAANTGRFEDEGWRVRKDGTRFWANVVITALRRPDGTLLGYAKVTRDLTKRREAEEVLRQSEERFRLLVEGVRDYAIFMLDPDGRVATWNRGAERINGYRESEIVGQHFSKFYTREDLSSRKPERELEIASTTGTYEEEGLRVRKDGTKYWANVLITALRNRSGELVGFGKLTRDLTERRAAEEKAMADARRVAAEEGARREVERREQELRALNEELRRRTLEAEEALRRADEANRAKSAFLAAMSHELRTPLNAIGGYTDILSMGLSGPLTDDQAEQLARIKKSQGHLLGIITDILNFSRIEAGKLDYDLRPLPLHHVMESVGLLMLPQAMSRGITLDVATDNEQLAATGDRGKVEQIVLNLVSNAVKFTNAGHVGIRALRVGKDKVGVEVCDTGVGIPHDQLSAIFEPFYQLGRTLTSPADGTGLGLAISRDLARAMGGDVVVESVLGKGSTFTLVLPAAH
jgi:PAS domain S-box-containing protein